MEIKQKERDTEWKQKIETIVRNQMEREAVWHSKIEEQILIRDKEWIARLETERRNAEIMWKQQLEDLKNSMEQKMNLTRTGQECNAKKKTKRKN